MTNKTVIRQGLPDDAEVIAAICEVRNGTGTPTGSVENAPHTGCVVAETGAVVIGVGWIDPVGSPVHPHVPLLETRLRSAAEHELRAPLIRALLNSVVDGGGTIAIACADPLDYTATSLLESMGFRPSGGPYHLLGRGTIEYITGYQSAAGGVLDFVIHL